MDREGFKRTYGIVGKSQEMQEIVDVVQQVAPTDITVLISGEAAQAKKLLPKRFMVQANAINKLLCR